MDDSLARTRLLRELRRAREALVWKLDGLSEYDARRPLTPTGTNLLGLVKHCAIWESRYLGSVFERPFPEPLPAWDDRSARGTDHWATEHETRDDVVGLARRVGAHAEATVEALALDTRAYVPWWRSDATLFDVAVHVVLDATRHAGHADVLREGLDGALGVGPEHAGRRDDEREFWEARWAVVEAAARAADPGGP